MFIQQITELSSTISLPEGKFDLRRDNSKLRKGEYNLRSGIALPVSP
jgi:hypothetical protein